MAIHSNDAATIRPGEFRFTSTDGVRVECTRWDSRGPLRGVVQIAHAIREHIGRYAGTIEDSIAAGYVLDHTVRQGERNESTTFEALDDEVRPADANENRRSLAELGEQAHNGPSAQSRKGFAHVMAGGLILLAQMCQGCAVNPVSGRRQVSILSAETEGKLGREAAREVAQTMGITVDAQRTV